MSAAPAKIAGLAAVLIVRDEAPVIAEALASVRGHVDEAIVVDTGSKDGTPELARLGGAFVGFFQWCDDFSAARNAALALAQRRGHRWALILDADELVSGGWAALAAWLAQAEAAGAPGWGCATVTSLGDEGQAQAHTHARILRLGACHYEGRVHEQPRGPGTPTVCGLEIAHRGYQAAELQRKDKPARNAELLRRELARLGPDDRGAAFYRWQLALSLIQGGALRRPRSDGQPLPEADHEHPLFHLLRAAAAAPEDAPWLPSITRDLAQTLALSSKRTEALQVIWPALQRWPDFTDLRLLEGAILFDVDHERCDAKAVEVFGEALRRGDAPAERYCALRGAGSYLAHFYLGRIHERRGRWGLALGHYQQAAPHHRPAAEALARLSDAAASDRPEAAA